MIIFRLVLIFPLFVTFTNCSNTHPIHYSKSNIEQEKIHQLYKDIPVFQDVAAKQFIIELKNPIYPKNARKMGLSGTVYLQPLIDEKGIVEAIFINESLGSILDDAAINAILSSKFKTYYEVFEKKTKYSLLVPINFALGVSVN